MKKIIGINSGLFLATYKGYNVLKFLVENRYTDRICFVVSFEERNVQETFHDKIREICNSNSIDYYDWKDIKQALPQVINEYKTNRIIAVSWRFLLPVELQSVLKYGLVVIHDSLLPKYRGFAPTPAAIINGETELGITALYADEGVDSGNIIMQKSYMLGNNQNISDAIHIQGKLYAQMVYELLYNYEYWGTLGIEQEENQATYSIWRDEEDCHIDFSESAQNIINLIRAVSKPYLGAYVFLDDEKVIIDKAEVISDINFVKRFPGKIWKMENGMPEVVCGQGMIRIIEARYEDGTPCTFHLLRKRFK